MKTLVSLLLGSVSLIVLTACSSVDIPLAKNITFEDTILVKDLVFEDKAFKSCIVWTVGSTAPIKRVQELDCRDKNITSIEGVEQLTSLVSLNLRNNQLTTLDVSANPKLVTLLADKNRLTDLDISTNTKLTTIHVSDNQLVTLDTSANTALRVLFAPGNQLTDLDLSNNTKLDWLNVGYNQLVTLDITANTALMSLYADNNKLTDLDFSTHSPGTLVVDNNQLTNIYFGNEHNFVYYNINLTNNPLNDATKAHLDRLYELKPVTPYIRLAYDR